MELVHTGKFDLAVKMAGKRSSEKIAILLPGRLDTKDYVNFASHLQYLANKGYFAVAFDPPGTWESPGKIEFTTSSYINALNDILGFFGNKPTILLGHSRGGQVAMLVGASNPLVEGFILVNASYEPPSLPDPNSVRDDAVIESRDLPPGGYRTAKQRKFLLSMDYFRDSQRYDPLPLLRECTKPKLVFYSTDDQFIDPKDVERILEMVPEPKMAHELKCDHNYRYYPEIINEVNNVTGEFLDRYLV